MKSRKKGFLFEQREKEDLIAKPWEILDKSFLPDHPRDHKTLEQFKRAITASRVIVLNFPQSGARWTVSLRTTAFCHPRYIRNAIKRRPCGRLRPAARSREMTDGIKKFSVGTRPELASWRCISMGRGGTGKDRGMWRKRVGERKGGHDCIKQIALVQELCLNRMWITNDPGGLTGLSGASAEWQATPHPCDLAPLINLWLMRPFFFSDPGHPPVTKIRSIHPAKQATSRDVRSDTLSWLPEVCRLIWFLLPWECNS